MQRSRNYCFTINNWNQTELNVLLEIGKTLKGIKYLTWGEEISESGTNHLQGFVSFKNGKTLNALKKVPPFERAHLEIKRGTFLQAAEYCWKDNTNVEKFGDLPMDQISKGDTEIQRWELAKEAATQGLWDEIPADILIRGSSGLRWVYQLALESKQLPEIEGELENAWYWGPAGTGKSRHARDKHTDIYLKAKNKWWGGYTDQQNVLVDDVAPEHERWMAPFLKEWADRYPFQCEVKGGSMMIRPKKIIITSQYSIESCFQDHETVAALRRRFKVTHFNYPIGHPNHVNYPTTDEPEIIY